MLKLFVTLVAMIFLASCQMHALSEKDFIGIKGLDSILKSSNPSTDDTPYPFTRELNAKNKPVGVDVYILKELLRRCFAKQAGIKYITTADSISASKTEEVYTNAVASDVSLFQKLHNIKSTGIFNKETARAILAYVPDGYTDDKRTAQDFGMKYKISIPVKADRSVETIGYLFDEKNVPILIFTARTHGKSDKNVPWPSFDDRPGFNEFVSSGNTPTGLSYVDFNTPEPADYVDEYGPYEVNRITTGIVGNSAIILPNVRNGILIHTGNWDKYGWDGVGPMPNSSGCIHVHPESAKEIAEALKSLGVEAHENPFGQ